MSAQNELIEGTNRDVGLSQWFTPSDLAKRVVEWAFEGRAMERLSACVLEPSAGNGALVRPLVAAGAHVMAVELDPRYFKDLSRALGLGVREHTMLCPADFLECKPGSALFDLCVMNPPYEDGKDVAFILHALKFAPRVVGIFRSALLHGSTRKRELWAHVRPTRIAFLADRPKFGEGNGARSDFIVADLVRILEPTAGYPAERNVNVEWW